jgi:4-hydroxy-tetrahydrodipicolinate synthase
MTREQVELIELAKARKHEEAGALGRRVQALADVVFAPPVANYRARLKEGLVMLGVLEHAYVREPLLPVSDGERSRLRIALVEAGLLAPPGLARVAS